MQQQTFDSEARRAFSKARWIWPNRHHWDIVNSYALFRKSFVVDTLPKKAPIFITADQSYRLFVNGAYVCRGPARGFQSHWPYDEVDVRGYLRKGRNVLAVRAYNPGRSTFQYISAGFAGLLLSAHWGNIRLASNSEWKSIRQGNVSRDTLQTSMQLFNQEHIDLRLDGGDWTALDFDDLLWEQPVADRPWNGAPWFNIQPRGIPMLTEKLIGAGKMIGVGQGTCANNYRSVRDVVALRFREDRSHRRIASSRACISVKASRSGSFRSYLIDFGRTVVGNLKVRFAGAAGGEIIDTHFTETVDLDTLTPDLLFNNFCRNSLGDRLICREGDGEHLFYHAYGFRYLNITVRDARKDFEIRPSLQWIGYPLERKGQFQSSDHDLTKIWEACAWTQQCCSLDAYVDTPWREQAQWWGDARVQAWNTFHLSGDPRLLRRGIAQIASQTTLEGLTYGHAPTMAHECILPDFTLIWILTLWDYCWQTGSTEPFETHQEKLMAAFEYFRNHADKKSGLVEYDDRFWLFLDWTQMFREGVSSVYNLWLLIALERTQLLCRRSQTSSEPSWMQPWIRKIRASLQKMINADGLLRDGLRPDGRMVASTCVHTQTLAVIAELKGLDKERAIRRVILPSLDSCGTQKSGPSAYWITYCFSVLAQAGYQEQVISCIKEHWLRMANHGTTWENFNPRRGDESFSHAWSAHPLFHLMQIIGGIAQTEAGWSRISFSPYFHGEHNLTVVPTPFGSIRSEWKKHDDIYNVDLSLPEGIVAEVYLPGRKKERVSGARRWAVKAQAFVNFGQRRVGACVDYPMKTPPKRLIRL